jgi:hypothetical protein
LSTGTSSDAVPPSPAAIEHIEAAAWTDLQLSLPAAFRRQWDVDVIAIGSAAALRASRADVLTINRVIGLGHGQPVTAATLDQLINWYATAGTHRFVIQWSPEAQPTTTVDLLVARDFKAVSYWSSLWRPLSLALPEAAESDVIVKEIGLAEATVFEEVVAQPLGVPAALGPGVRSTIGKPGWRFYLAYADGAPIAGAASYSEGGGAWLGIAGTREEFRNRGAQTALLTRRIRDAALDGCRWVSAHTQRPTSDRPNPSYRNMIRLGFTSLYDRPNYVSPGLRPPI